MDDNQLIKTTNSSDVRGIRLRARPRMGRMDSAKKAFDAKIIYMKQRRMLIEFKEQL